VCVYTNAGRGGRVVRAVGDYLATAASLREQTVPVDAAQARMIVGECVCVCVCVFVYEIYI
jgi:hypothetical protein